MSKTSDGTRSEPLFASSGNAPTFAADLSLLSTFFAARSFRRFTTVALLLGSSGSGTDDYAIATNAPGAWFRNTGSGWVMHGTAQFASSAARSAAIGAPVAGMRSRRADVTFDEEYDGSVWFAVPYGAYVGRAIRNTNTPSVASASFTNLSATANWLTTGQGVVKGFAAYADGWTIPVSGLYEVAYNVVTVAGCLTGITVNNAAPSAGTALEAVSTGAVVQGSAGQAASVQLELDAGDVIRLFAITNTSTTTAFASVGHFTVTWIGTAS